MDQISLDGWYELMGGEYMVITLFAEKYIHLKGKCQNLFPSENELWLHRVVENVRQICANPCVPDINLGMRLNEIVKGNPICKNSKDLDCALNAVIKAKPTDPTSRPCRRVHYIGVTSKGMAKSKRISYYLVFKDPSMITVKEEYLIYDRVGLISSVGGILGICVGISFYGISENLVGLMMVGMNWYQKAQQKQRRGKCIHQ